MNDFVEAANTTAKQMDCSVDTIDLEGTAASRWEGKVDEFEADIGCKSVVVGSTTKATVVEDANPDKSVASSKFADSCL